MQKWQQDDVEGRQPDDGTPAHARRLTRVGVAVGIRAAAIQRFWQRHAVDDVPLLITDDAAGIQSEGVAIQARCA